MFPYLQCTSYILVVVPVSLRCVSSAQKPSLKFVQSDIFPCSDLEWTNHCSYSLVPILNTYHNGSAMFVSTITPHGDRPQKTGSGTLLHKHPYTDHGVFHEPLPRIIHDVLTQFQSHFKANAKYKHLYTSHLDKRAVDKLIFLRSRFLI